MTAITAFKAPSWGQAFKKIAKAAAKLFIGVPCMIFCWAFLILDWCKNILYVVLFLAVTAFTLARVYWLVSFLCSCLLVSVLVVPTPARAMTVSDPTSYIYYVEQIKQLTDHAEQLSEQVTEQQNTVQGVKEIFEQLKGAYYTMADLREKLLAVQKEAEANPLSLLKYFKRFGVLKDGEKEPTYDIEGVLKEEDLDSVFIDVRQLNGDYGPDTANDRYHVRQAQLKDVIIQGGNTVLALDGSLKNLNELLIKIDTEKDNPTTKSAVDWNSRVLAEAVIVLNKMLTLQARHFMAQATLDYEGANDETHAEKQEEIQAYQTPRERGESYKEIYDVDVAEIFKK